MSLLPTARPTIVDLPAPTTHRLLHEWWVLTLMFGISVILHVQRSRETCKQKLATNQPLPKLIVTHNYIYSLGSKIFLIGGLVCWESSPTIQQSMQTKLRPEVNMESATKVISLLLLVFPLFSEATHGGELIDWLTWLAPNEATHGGELIELTSLAANEVTHGGE